ncbi:MAG: homoserine O-acetyltransferase [Acidimicrobiia bacterium]
MTTNRPTGAEPLPVTGAWRPGDPAGRRQFVTMAERRPLALEGGGTLGPITIAYETWGTLASDRSNAVLICHAWTGDSHVAGPAGVGHPTPGWWEGMVGPGLAIDTDRYFVVCANVLGGCQGSTGPASIDPVTGAPYGSRFPVVTIRDMVRTHAVLADELGIGTWLSVVGGSMGGMQVLEWAVTFPDRVRSVVPIASCAQATAQQIAWGAVGRRALKLDPRWRGGDYYDAAPGDGPHDGLSTARMLAQITFRSDDVFTDRFGREMADRLPENQPEKFALWQRFEVERYLDYHGEKLVRRFDANSYLLIGKAMDLHDVGRDRGGLEAALARVHCPVLSIGIRSDLLYPKYQQEEIAALVNRQGGVATYVEVDSPHGHDGFLINIDQVGNAITPFLEKVANE